MADYLEGSIEEAAAAIERLSAPQTEAAPAHTATETTTEIQPQPEADEAAPVTVENDSEEAEASAAAVPDPVITPEPKASPASSTELEQKLGEAEKATQEATAVKQQLATHVNTLNVLVPQMENAIRGEFADIKSYDDLRALANPNSPTYNPDRYNSFVIRQGELQQAQQAQRNANDALQRTRAEESRKAFSAEQQRLHKMMPELADPEKGRVLASKMEAYAKKIGIKPERLSSYTAEEFVALNKAMRFEDMAAQKTVAAQKAAKAPPVQQPGTTRVDTGNSKAKELYGRAQKSGRVDDLAAYFDAVSN